MILFGIEFDLIGVDLDRNDSWSDIEVFDKKILYFTNYLYSKSVQIFDREILSL